MMDKTLIPLFLLLWSGFAVFLWASVFSRATRALTVLLMFLSLATLIGAVKFGFKKTFPVQIEEYSVESRERVLIGNGPGSHLIIFNPKSDDPHLALTFGRQSFSLLNLSEKRRAQVDGLFLDEVRLRKGESFRVGDRRIAFLSIKFLLPFSATVVLNLDGKRVHRFLMNSKLRVRTGDLTWNLAYIPPSLLGINLLFWELLLALLLSFIAIFLLFRGYYLSASGIFLALAGAFFPFLLIPALPLVILALILERRPAVALLLIFFSLPVLFPGKIGVRAKQGRRPLHFEKKFSYGTHRLVLGKTPYLMEVKPLRITLKPLGVEGFRRKFSKIIYSPVEVKGKEYLYLPFPKEFHPARWKDDRIVLKGKNASLSLSPGKINALKFSLPFLILAIFYIFSLALGSDFVMSTVFFFFLSLGGIFIKAAALFDPSFSFTASSYIKLGALPAALLFLLLSPGFLPKVKRTIELLTGGLSIRETLSLLRLEGSSGISFFEALSRPIAGEVLWVDFLFLLSLILIALQFLMGSETGIRSSGLSLQFFEAGKILLAIYLADWLFRSQENKFVYPTALPYVLILLPFLLLIFTLGDFSPLAVFFPAILAHFILVNKPLRVKIPMALVFSLAGLLGFWLSLKLFFPADVALRLKAWLTPGLFSRASEQFVRAFWLFHSGGLTGNFPQGFVNSHSVPLLLFDFPLALFTANFGLAGAGLLLFSLFPISARLFFRAETVTYQGRWNFYVLFFSHLVFFSQVLLPFLILTGILPVMGQPLPFLSKANSDLILFVLPFFLLNLYLLGKENA